jgi:trimeric autotransporter adhesin
MLRFLTIFLLFSIELSAQQVRLVKDLNPGSDSGFPTFDEQYRIYAGLDTTCIFLASGKGNIRLLCSSNGTDIGTISILPPLATDEQLLYPTVSGNLFWFVIRDANNHDKLYSTDGTWSGTQLRVDETLARINLVRAINGGVVYSRNPDSFDPEELVRVRLTGNTVAKTILAKCNWFGGLLSFAVKDSNVIWAVGSQETTSDRYLFKCTGQPNSRTDITVMNTGSEFNQHLFMTPVGDKCFWFWKKGSEPYKLWVSDGTATGTVGLKDFEIPSFQDLIAERAIIAFQGKLLFQAENLDSNVGRELWESNGTEVGTKLVKDFADGTSDGLPDQMVIYKNRLYFKAKNAFWNTKIHAYVASTSTVNEAYSGFASNEYYGTDIEIFRDSLVFGGYRASVGSELMTAGEGAASVRVLSDQSGGSSDNFYPRFCKATKNKLFFSGNIPGTQGNELWLYDPTATVSTWGAIQPRIQLELGPNPATDIVRVQVPETLVGDCRIYMYNSTGKLVLTKAGLQGGVTCEMSVVEFAVGVYQILLIDAKGKVAGAKLVVE